MSFLVVEWRSSRLSPGSGGIGRAASQELDEHRVDDIGAPDVGSMAEPVQKPQGGVRYRRGNGLDGIEFERLVVRPVDHKRRAPDSFEPSGRVRTASPRVRRRRVESVKPWKGLSSVRAMCDAAVTVRVDTGCTTPCLSRRQTAPDFLRVALGKVRNGGGGGKAG